MLVFPCASPVCPVCSPPQARLHSLLPDKIERCMGVMQSGTQMVKLKNGSKGLVRLFYLDEHRSCIRWRPSRKSEKAKITIDSLYKVMEGCQSDIFHRHAEGNFDSSCCFTIYHGNHMESLDLVTSNPEEARTWVTGLRYLMAGISDEDSLAKRQRTHDQYPFSSLTFEEADKNGDGLLNIEEIYQLLHKINVNLPRRKVKQMFQEADTDDQQGTLTYEEFSVFYKMMSLRRDLYLLLMAYSDRKDHLTAEDLGNFLRTEQKMTSVTTEYCLDIVEKFEVSEENKQKGVLGIEGFTSFMRSPTCDVFNPLHHQVNQDMDQPLCNYYIASSHNTYLTGDQLLSNSKTDMYAWVLQNGCRCVEGGWSWTAGTVPDGEPMVQHGYTLTSKITFKAVVETINKYAFINNEYPVVLSIENHCTIQQQKKMARYLQEIFGDKLDLGGALNKDSKQLPSPNLLKGKILIKGKRLPSYLSADADEGEVSDDDSADEIEDGFNLKDSGRKAPSRSFISNLKQKVRVVGRRRKTIKLSRDLSDLVVFTNSIAAQDSLEESTPLDVLSFSETRAQHLVHHQAERFVSFNQRQLSRIYPSAYRIDSSNFNPQTYWNVGCQLVALNYQTEGRMMQLNRAKFLVNGNSGYVLKPPPMCKGSFSPFSDDPLPACPKKQLLLKIISGQQLPKPPDSMLGDRGEIIDPFVEVEIIGLPVDCCKEQTRVVDDNGFNPVWEETLSFTLHMPELALVRFLVWDHDPIGRDFVGQRTVAFSSLMPGYRHVYLEGLTEASVFVHVTVHDMFGKWSPLVLNPSYTILHFLGAHKGRQLRGIKGLFSRGSRSCADAPPGPPLRKRSISQQLLRRTASAPAKGRKKAKPLPPPDGEGVMAPPPARPPRAPLRHRPISMPLEKQLQGSLVLSPSEQDGPVPISEAPPGEYREVRGQLDYFSSMGHTAPQYRTMQHHPGTLALPGGSAEWTTFSEGERQVLNPDASASLQQSVARSARLSEVSLQDSALSQLIDAVSLGNGEDTYGSISALIGQIDVTGEQNSLTVVSNTPGVNGHNFTLTLDGVSPPDTHDAFDTPLFSSPETTDPAIYTILDEVVLSPVSPPRSQGSVPGDSWTSRCLETQYSWDPARGPWKGFGFEKGWDSFYSPSSTSGCTNSTASDRFVLCQDSANSSLMEVEINVDGDPQDVTLTSPGWRPWWADLNTSQGYHMVNGAPMRPCSDSITCARTEQHRSANSLHKHGDCSRNGGWVSKGFQLPERTHKCHSTQSSSPPYDWPRFHTSEHATVSPDLTAHLPGPTYSPAPSPCMSKSLGDLTSEDISCNFQSKYKFISRSFKAEGTGGRKQPGSLAERLPSADPLTEQLRRLVSFDQDECSSPHPSPLPEHPRVLSRKLSSRSQSRVRHIASRARERQQEVGQPRFVGTPCGTRGVVLRTKATAHHHPANRHSTGSYIIRYLEQREDRGLPEGSCTTPLLAKGDRCWAGETAPPADCCQPSEPEVYFLLRL
uniref:Phosphoinositide phospholipase C n=1 Tax=Scleropages formosus TaxID=113540 RepID=A0A8C9TZN4_SCLFO